MGHSDSFSAKSDPIPVVSAGVDSRHYAHRSARLGQDASDLGQAVPVADRGGAVQYCISNDLI
ncbi:MAG: hypothetical protein R3D62_11035 [Xanthobacteraceae bacterium]